jgi:predicted DNA-binding transcriptional regulator AlpA
MYNMSDEYLTTKQVSEIIGLSQTHVSRLVQDGKFPGAKKLNPTSKNSPIRIPKSSVDAFVSAQVITPRKPYSNE